MMLAVDWDQLEQQLREKIREQPRGFQTELAERLGVNTASVAGYTSKGKGIPVKHLGVILDMLGLELELKKRSSE